MTSREEIEALLKGFDVSNWLKTALKEALRRDPVDAANDAEVLFTVLNKRSNEALKAFTRFSA